MSVSEPKLPEGFDPRMLSFDVYGTLVNTPPANLRARMQASTDSPRCSPRSVWVKGRIAEPSGSIIRSA